VQMIHAMQIAITGTVIALGVLIYRSLTQDS
jgi:hypothetical protein